jgi:hypothetical protein
MRFKVYLPGDTRIVDKFALFPIESWVIDKSGKHIIEKRWMERVTILQTFKGELRGWYNTYFIDKLENTI